MSKTTAPALSFDARGQIGKAMVYSGWRGLSTLRRYTVPANPNTTEQQDTRGIFRLLNRFWTQSGTLARAPWELYAQGRPLLPVNAYVKFNLPVLRSPTPSATLAPFIGSPGAAGGLAPVSFNVVPSTTTATGTLVAPTLPSGWTITQAVCVVIGDQDPLLPYVGPVLEFFDNSAPYTGLNITGLVTATDYVAAAWFEYVKPNGAPAYSVSLTDTFTTS